MIESCPVLFVITTDGLENASREYSFEHVRALVTRQKEQFGWEFLFLGANMDAVATAASFGIAEDRAANFKADAAGVNLSYNTVNEIVSDIRARRTLHKDWKDQLEKDSKKR